MSKIDKILRDVNRFEKLAQISASSPEEEDSSALKIECELAYNAIVNFHKRTTQILSFEMNQINSIKRCAFKVGPLEKFEVEALPNAIKFIDYSNPDRIVSDKDRADWIRDVSPHLKRILVLVNEYLRSTAK